MGPTTIARYLDVVTEIIRARGWTRDVLVDGDGCVCLAGAMFIACGGKVLGKQIVDYNEPDYNALVIFIRRFIGTPMSLSAWNDAQATDEDVIDMLQLARESLRVD